MKIDCSRLIFLLFLFLTKTSLAEVPGVIDFCRNYIAVKNKPEHVNVTSEPKAESTVIKQLDCNKGIKVEIIGEKGVFYKIIYPRGGAGYVPKRRVRTKGLSNTDLGEVPGVIDFCRNYIAVKNKPEYVNVTSEPKAESTVIKQLDCNKGIKVGVIGEEGEFYRILYPKGIFGHPSGIIGYVSKRFVDITPLDTYDNIKYQPRCEIEENPGVDILPSWVQEVLRRLKYRPN